jgi:hypothetical protein
MVQRTTSDAQFNFGYGFHFEQRNVTVPGTSLSAGRCRGTTEEAVMVNEPNDPYRANDLYRANNPSRSRLGEDDREAHLERELQADPELNEGPASGAKIALFALGIALVLGAVFYGLNNTSVHQAGTSSSTAQNAAPTSPPPAAPGMRNATPRANTGPGTTTGAAPSPTSPPPAPTAPANNAPASK